MKKLSAFLKKNWLPILVIGVTILAVFTLWKQSISDDLYESLMQRYNQQQVEHQNQIKALESVNNDLLQRFLALQNSYDEKIKGIETRYDSSLTDLASKLSKDKKVLVKKATEKPDYLIDVLSKDFSIQNYDGEVKSCQ